jgi:long-chain acyl-CoA synthetase
LALAAAIVNRDLNLVWFPEGERSPTGELQAFKPGIGLLLDRYPILVVPIVISGTYEAMPRGRMLPRPRRIRVTFFEAVDADTLEREGEGDEAEDRISAALHDRMKRLG